MMGERVFKAATKGLRLAAVLFALMLALAALQFGARSAEAGLALISSGAGGYSIVSSGADYCLYLNYTGAYTRIANSPTALNWTGTDANEKRCGNTTEADYLDGAGGSDILWGSGGNNTVKGGTGDDTLSAYSGADQFYPGDGEDAVYAGYGNDTIVMYADGKPDYIYGGGGVDTVRLTSCHLDSTDRLDSVEFISRPSC